MPMAFTREEVKNLSNGIAAISVLLLLAFGAYYYVVVRTEFEQTRLKLAESESRVEELEQQLASAKQENSVLLDAFYSEQAKMDAFSRQIEEITGVVGILQQLQGTDRELLQKYSRTYFLSENYVPSNLAPIQERYLYNSNDQQLIHADVQPHLENMINTAASANVDLKIVSAYRMSSRSLCGKADPSKSSTALRPPTGRRSGFWIAAAPSKPRRVKPSQRASSPISPGANRRS